MSPNTKRRLITGALTGVSGWLLMTCIIVVTCNGSMLNCMSSSKEASFPAFMGAAIGGVLVFRLFGQPGRRGWWLAMVGAVLATALGALFGLIFMGVIQDGMRVFGNAEMFFVGPIFLLLAFGMMPGLIPLWGGSMIGIHLIMRRFFQ